MSGVLELSFLILVLGAKGFTRAGMPFSAKRNITGKSAKILGTFCVLLGLSGIAFAYWGSPPAGRQALASVGQGILIGFVGAILAFGGIIQERLSPDDLDGS
jgi:hypothetical protein